MGDSRMHSRAVALLKSGNYSDVEIQVIDGETCKTFQTHKLFLAMGSKVFGEIFFNKKESPKFLKIYGFQPAIVYMMLEFLYTDRIDAIKDEEIKDLYRLSKKYEIEDLESYCINFFIKEEITLENVFTTYKFALSEKIAKLLNVCRDLVSSKALELLKSQQFTDVPEYVVNDILQLDSLNVKSEMDVLNATIEWAKNESYKRNEKARICLCPLLKHIRFLTLSAPEFCNFLENNENVLNSHESAVLTMAIIQPQFGRQLPTGFNGNTSRRSYANLLSLDSLNDNLDHSFEKPSNNTKSFDFDTSVQVHLQDNFGLLSEKNKNIKQKTSFPKMSSVIGNFTSDDTSFVSKPQWSDGLVISNKKSNVHMDQYQKPSPPISVNKCGHGDSSYSYERKQTPLLKVTPRIPMGQRRTFDFPLSEFEKGMNSAFPSDITCSCNIFLLRGVIEIYGIELKILSASGIDNEIIMVHVSLSGTNYPTRSMLSTEKLKNCICPIIFEEPLKLYQKQNIKIEVTIEDIILSRIYVFHAEKCDLNCGLGVSAEITMQSNQPTKERSSFFYLISRLLYKPC